MADERLVITVRGKVMAYNMDAREWCPAGTASGDSAISLIHNSSKNTFRLFAQRIDDENEVVLNCDVTTRSRFNQDNECFIQWRDPTTGCCWGIHFTRGSNENTKFLRSVCLALEALKQNYSQPTLQSQLSSQNQSVVSVHQRALQQQQQQQQQQPQQQQQTILHHQVNPMIQQQQQPPPQMMAQHLMQQQASQMQASVQQQSNQQAPSLLQQQPVHLQQQQLQHQLLQQQQQQQQQQHQLHQQVRQPMSIPLQTHPNQSQPQQTAPPTASNIPPPPPPPPEPKSLPMPSSNSNKNNGFSASTPQQSPVNNINLTNGNGAHKLSNGSLSFANELSKAGNQLRKVSLTRSDSDAEKNNNVIPNAKTQRAASLQVNLMDDLKKRVASRREKADSASNNNGSEANSNGDTSQYSWLADLVKKELSKEMAKMKVEIIEAIKTELRQR